MIGWNLPLRLHGWLENAASKASSSLEKFDRAGEKQLEEVSTRYDGYLTVYLTLRLPVQNIAKTCPHK
jgi:hypothetical protein